jgi:hypothetical protein
LKEALVDENKRVRELAGRAIEKINKEILENNQKP